MALKEIRKRAVREILKRGIVKDHVQQTFTTIKEEIDRFPLHERPLRSRELLRFKLNTRFSEQNFAPETLFEKHLAKEAEEAKDIAWANQIPIWSGLCEVGSKANIDIGFMPRPGHFRLFELKIGTDHPLYALIEVVTYALGYLSVRKVAGAQATDAVETRRIRSQDAGLLDAKNLHWTVIAPESFYLRSEPRFAPLSLQELLTLCNCVTEFLSTLTRDELDNTGVQMDFSFLVLEIGSTGFNKDESSRQNWIDKIKGGGTLRDLILSGRALNSISNLQR